MSRAATVVLMYHRVADGDKDPLGLCVRPARFEEQVRHLGQRFGIVPLGDVLRRSSTPRVAITFDDGYADNAEVAAPLLASAHAPATFFVTSRVLHDRSPFWWDILEVLMGSSHSTGRARVEVEVAGQRFFGDVHTPSARGRTLTELKWFCYRLSAVDAFDSVVRIAAQLGVDPTGFEDAFLTREQVRELAAHADFDVGAHSVTHTRLDRLAPDAGQREIVDSRLELSAAAGQPITFFSYPHGGHNRAVTRMVARAGYALACTVEPRAFRRCASRFRIPRLAVEDISGVDLVDRVTESMELVSLTRRLAHRAGALLTRASRAGR